MRDIESVKGSERSHLQRSDAVHHVIDRAGGAGEVKDVIDVARVKRLAYVFFYKLETRFIAKMLKIGAPAGQQIVDHDHAPTLAEQGIGKMRAQKSGSARH